MTEPTPTAGPLTDAGTDRPRRRGHRTWAARPPSRVRLALAAACCLPGVASSSVVTAIPSITATLHTSLSTAGLVVVGFFVGATVGVVAAGRAVDLLGARRILLGGLAVALIASFAAAMAPSVSWLIAARVALGAASASLYPATLSALSYSNRRACRPVTTGLSAIVMASEPMFALGPVVGGAAVSMGGWRAACLILLPIAGLALVLVATALPQDPDGTQAPTTVPGGRARFDVVGAAWFTLVVALFVSVMLVPVRVTSWTAAIPLVLCIGLAVLILHCRRVRSPLLDLGLMVRPQIGLALTRTALVYVAVFGCVLGVPLWLQGNGMDAVTTGAALIPITVVSVISMALAWRTVNRGAVRGPLAIGAASLMCFGTVVLLTHSMRDLAMTAVVAVLGIACGTVALSNHHVLIAATPQHQALANVSIVRSGQLVAGILASVLVIDCDPGTDSGLRALALGVVALGVVLAASTVIVRSHGEVWR